jgi:uncharacterized protein with PIN domain
LNKKGDKWEKILGFDMGVLSLLKSKDECTICKDRLMLTRTNNMHCSIVYIVTKAMF